MLDEKQKPQRNDMPKRLDKSVRAVIQNATRLLEDAQFLEFSEPPTSAWFIGPDLAEGETPPVVLPDAWSPMPSRRVGG